MFDKQFTERIIEKCSADYKTNDKKYLTVVALNKLLKSIRKAIRKIPRIIQYKKLAQ
jgi:hypothetical protein